MVHMVSFAILNHFVLNERLMRIICGFAKKKKKEACDKKFLKL